jgi:hypothetical protein
MLARGPPAYANGGGQAAPVNGANDYPAICCWPSAVGWLARMLILRG